MFHEVLHTAEEAKHKKEVLNSLIILGKEEKNSEKNNQHNQVYLEDQVSGMKTTMLMLLLLLLSRLSRVRLCVTSQTAAHQAPPSLGFSRQEHWSGLPFPPPMHESEKSK